MRLQVGDDPLVGEVGPPVECVGASVDPAGLAEVHVGIHQPGDHPGPAHVRGVADATLAGTRGAGPGAGDAPAAHHDDGVRHRGGAGSVDQRGAGEDDRCWVLGVRC